MLLFGYHDYMGWWEGDVVSLYKYGNFLSLALTNWSAFTLSDALLYFYDSKHILILIL